MPAIHIGDITFDVTDTRRMAEFWAAALRYEVQEITPEWAAAVDPGRRYPRCCFQRVNTPKPGKNRVHFDLFTKDMPGEVARLVTLGATRVRQGEDGGAVWTVLQDPEGNEFCVQPPPSGAP